MGRFARAALESGEARVIAVFERSVYVETPAGLACIGVVGNGPLNAHCKEGAVAQLRGAAVGDLLNVDLSAAVDWCPRPAPILYPALASRGLNRLRDAAHDRYPAEGFGFAIEPARPRPPAIEALAAWLASPTTTPEAARGLIGLGPGLTPSGDDLIGGTLCALHAMSDAALAKRLADWALPIASEATNRISNAHLACAAQGECGDSVNNAIVALLGGKPPDLDRIDAIGHTSGWDALAGAALALAARVHRS